jgi:hypothetical protein
MPEPGRAAEGPLELSEAASWIGYALDAADHGKVGRVQSVFVDAAASHPTWLIVALGKRGARRVAVPAGECAGGGGRVWTAQTREAMADAPAVDPSRPLLREHELVISAHYGIGEGTGRSAELAPREPGSVTSQPLS